MQSSFVVEGLLHLVADVEPCLWFAAPIMKALMADSMVGRLRGETERETEREREREKERERGVVLILICGL